MSKTLTVSYTFDEIEIRAIKNIIALSRSQNTREELKKYNGSSELPKEEFLKSLDVSYLRGEELIRTLEAIGLAVNKRKKINKEDKKAKAVLILIEEKIEEITEQLLR